jgi:hypothetical protein
LWATLITVQVRRLDAAPPYLRTVPRLLSTTTRCSHRPSQLIDRKRLLQYNHAIVAEVRWHQEITLCQVHDLDFRVKGSKCSGKIDSVQWLFKIDCRDEQIELGESRG